MNNIQEEAVRAVSISISSSDGEIFNSIENAQRKWQTELDSAKNDARTMLGDVLSQREILRSSLSTAAQLWNVLKPHEHEQPEEQYPQTASDSFDKENITSNDNFLATPDQLKMVRALQNVSHTIFLIEFILGVPEALEKAHNSLHKIQNEGLLHVHKGNAALLVEAHASLTAVERLRDVILLDAPQTVYASSTAFSSFSRARSIRDLLEDIIIHGVFSNVLPVSQTNPRLLVAAARVVDAEESEDKWWHTYLQRSTNAHRGSDVRPSDSLSYKERAIAAVLESLRSIFLEKEEDLGVLNDSDPGLTSTSDEDPEKSIGVYKGISSRLDILEVIKWIEQRRQEKQTVRRFVTPCIPPSFPVASLYEEELHRQLMGLVTKLLHLVQTDGSMALTEDDVIQLTTWYSKYKEDVGDQHELIDSFLSQTDRQRLITALQKHCADSIDSQIDAILGTRHVDRPGLVNNVEIRDNFQHSTIPGTREGLCRNDLSDVILRFIMDHVGHVLSLNVHGLDYAIAQTVVDRLNAFQETVRKAIREEQFLQTPDEYGHYTCTIANNMARCLEYSEDLRELFIPVAPDANCSAIENTLETIIEGFRITASMALLALINGMTDNLSIHATRFYAPNTGTEVMLDIVATLEDYFSEYEMHLLPFHFEFLVIECLKRIVVWYVAPFLKLSAQRPEEGVARRFTSLPTFDEANRAHGDDMFEEDIEQDIVSRRSDSDRGDKRMSKGLSTMNGEAVVAQINKDINNLSRVMRRRLVMYQKKQLEPNLEPMIALRCLYSCEATASGMSDAFVNARSVIMRCMRPSWVRECGVDGQLTARVAEVIWESRIDVNPVVLLEAITSIRTSSVDLGGDLGRRLNIGDGDVAAPSPIGDKSFSRLGGEEELSDEGGTESLVWAPSPSRLRWKRR